VPDDGQLLRGTHLLFAVFLTNPPVQTQPGLHILLQICLLGTSQVFSQCLLQFEYSSFLGQEGVVLRVVEVERVVETGQFLLKIHLFRLSRIYPLAQIHPATQEHLARVEMSGLAQVF
jgi:hypothetical protein